MPGISLTVPLISYGIPPSIQGLLGWSCDSESAANSSPLTVGQVALFKVFVPKTAKVSNVNLRIAGTAGTGLSGCYVGLYDMSGNLLSTSTDQSSNFATAVNKTVPIPPVTVQAGFVYAAMLCAAATTPYSVARSAGIDAFNNDLNPNAYRASGVGSGLTTLPATLNLSTASSLTFLAFAGVS